MQIIFFSIDIDITNEWKNKYSINNAILCYDIDSLILASKNYSDYIVLVDYDSISSELNKIFASGFDLNNIIVLEKSPEIATGKLLISRGVKAYANSRLLEIHYLQMIDTVTNGKVWTYPALTASLIKDVSSQFLSDDAMKLIENRLTEKEIEVVEHILNALSNDAIAVKLNITTRTVKAHISSIFSKLHVIDRISLVLLLK